MSRHFILALFAAAFCAAAAPRCVRSEEPVTPIPPTFAAEQRIKKALAAETECDFAETPLKDVMDYVKERHKIEIQFDALGMKAIANPPRDPAQILVSRSLRGVTLGSALNLLLNDLDLDWAVQDEVVMITTKEAAAAMLVNRVFDVGDLLSADRPDNLDSLSQTISATIAPASWKANGGLGTVQEFSGVGINALVVSQTWKNQERIEKLLSDLRRLKAAPIPRP